MKVKAAHVKKQKAPKAVAAPSEAGEAAAAKPMKVKTAHVKKQKAPKAASEAGAAEVS